MNRERHRKSERAAEWFWFGPPPYALRGLADRIVEDEAGEGATDLAPDARLALVLGTALRARDEEWRGRIVDAAVVRWPDEAEAQAVELLRNRGGRRRALGAELLTTLCDYRMDRIPRLVDALVAAFDRETDDRVLSLIIEALRHSADMEGATPPEREPMPGEEWEPGLDIPSGRRTRGQPLAWQVLHDERVERIAALARNPDPAIRRRLAISLEGLDLGNPVVLRTLVELTQDTDESVRDWATFELAMAYDEADDEEVRSALRERRSDPYWETRDEALYGLVMRRDSGAVAELEAALRSDEVSDYMLEAAADSCDPALVPALRELATWWAEPEAIADIIDVCEGAASQA